jgi:MFS family permease
MATATSKWQYLFAMSICFGLGGAFNTTMTVSTAISRWFVKYRGRAMALVLTSAGFAGMLGAPAMQWLMTANGGNWSQGWFYVAAINAVSGIIAYAFVKESPQALGQYPDGIVPGASTATAAGSAGAKAPSWTPGAVYKTAAFWLIVVACLANYFPFFFVSSHWVLHLRGVGISPASAAFAFGLFTMISILGRLVGGWLTDKIASRYVLMLGLAMMAAASYGASFISSETMAYLCSSLMGLGFGCALVVQNTILANYFGVAVFAQVFGMAMMIVCSVSAFGGVIGGKIFDIFRSYGPMLNINILLYILGIVALFFAIPAHEKAAPPATGDSSRTAD